MPAVLRLLDEARRRSDQLRRQLGDELRQARVRAGLSQSLVGRAVGCSASTISRVERGLTRGASIEQLMRHASVVGLVLRANMLPIGAPIRDAGQLKVLNRLQSHVGPSFTWTIEMLVGPNDLRAFDAGAVRPGCRIGFDVWSRVRDVQAQARASQRKQLDARADRLILVFGDTWTNRRAVRDEKPVHRARPFRTVRCTGCTKPDRMPPSASSWCI